MEQYPYSLEKAQDEATKMRALRKENPRLSYTDAHDRMAAGKKIERTTGRYEKDAGHEAEEMLGEVLEGMPTIFSIVELSSRYDDQKAVNKKVDVILTLLDGGKIAVQVSATENKDEMREKLGELVKCPLLTELHDNDGNVTLQEPIPRAIAGVDKVIWGKALNKALLEKSDSKISALPKKEHLVVLERIIESLKFAKQYRVDKVALFDDRIMKLEKGLKQLRAQP